MSDNKGYLIVDKHILPDCYERVVEARSLLRSGRAKDISDAVKAVNISRSTYYKYKDYVFSPNETAMDQKAVISLMLKHVQGSLSEVLQLLSSLGANILTISQNLPIHDEANVIVSIDMSHVTDSIDHLLNQLHCLKGVSSVHLIAID